MQVINWGVLGTGNIANKFSRGLASTEADAARYAVGSRSKEKAQEMAMKYGYARACGSYEEVISDENTHAVYIALPNHLHAEWAIKAAEAGKHVLVEKPAAINASQLESVLEAVKKNDVFFMEGFMYRCHPRISALKDLLAEEIIGKVQMIETSFVTNFGPQLDNYRLKNEMGGGVLMDMGCYCVSFARQIANCEPDSIRGTATIDPETRVDFHCAGALGFPNGIVASFICGNQTGLLHSEVRVYGTEGSILVTEPWGPVNDGAPIMISAVKGSQNLDTKAGKDLYLNEALVVAEHLENRQAPQVSWDDSLGQVKVMDALRADMGIKFDCE
jgi:predicted dehydrogenase